MSLILGICIGLAIGIVSPETLNKIKIKVKELFKEIK